MPTTKPSPTTGDPAVTASLALETGALLLLCSAFLILAFCL